MAAIDLPILPGAGGTTSEQLAAMHRYNALMRERLDYALRNIDGDNYSQTHRDRIAAIGDAASRVDDSLSRLRYFSESKTLAYIMDLVDGSVTVYYSQEAPQEKAVRDLWFDTDTTPPKVYRWTGILWADVSDSAIVAALTAAQAAKDTADGKIRSFADAKEPLGLTLADVGDLWINTAEANALYRWDGTKWVKVQDTHIEAYVRQTSDGVEVGEENGAYKGVFTPTGLIFYENNIWLGEFTNSQLVTHRITAYDKLVVGKDERGYYDFISSVDSLTCDFREKVIS